MFIENAGQFADGARFQVRDGNGTMWLAEDALWITITARDQAARPDRDPRAGPHTAQPLAAPEAPRAGVNIRLSFPGANAHPRIEPFDRLDTVVSYFLGNDPDKWRPDVPVWGGVRYVDLYPGVDLEITSEVGQMVQRLAARPDADLSAVRLRVEAADAVTVDGDVLRLSTAAGKFALPLLKTDGLQAANSKVQPRGVQAFDVVAPFASANSNPVSRDAGNRQSAIPNLQSPADLLYSTFLGGSDSEESNAIAVDGAGSVYVTGYTLSSDFPTTPGSFDSSFDVGFDDAYVVKLNPAGSGLAYATFVGGDGWDFGYGIAVDGAGSAYVTGSTDSSDFPTTPGAFDLSSNGGDAFVVKLNPAGSGLAYATLLGGSSGDQGSGIAVDGAGCAYVTGYTTSGDFPTTPGAFDLSYNGGPNDGFVVKLNPAGSGLAYATFLGGDGRDYGGGIAVDGAGSAYVMGSTESTNFPATPGAFDPSYNGSTVDFGDAYVVKLNPAGSGLAYATFLGGSYGDLGYAIAVDGVGSAYVTGSTESTNFPTTPGAFDTSYNGSTFDGFVVKLNPAGSGLAYATFLGGDGWDFGYGIAVDGAGSAYVTGVTDSNDFPTTPGAFDTSSNDYSGYSDGFVVKLNPAGSGLAYATFLGGGGRDIGHAIAVNGAGSTHVTGFTESSDFPTTPGVFDTSPNGGEDAFVVKLAVGGGATVAISGRVTDGTGDGIAGVAVSVGAAGSATTDGNGAYTLSGLAVGTYTLTPSKSGYIFSPSSRAVTVPPDASGQDFVGTPRLSVSHIEITQAIQDEGNNVPLIAGKPAFVRVYLDCGEGCSAMPGVTGVLRGYGPSAELSGSPVQPVNFSGITAFHENWTAQRGDLGKTLNFTLPPNWTSGTVRLQFDTAGVAESRTVTFQEARALKVGMVPIRYNFDGVDRSPDVDRIGRAQWWAARIYPTATVQVVPMSGMTWEGSCFGSYCGGDPCDMLSRAVKSLKRDSLMTRLWLAYQLYNLTQPADSGQRIDYIFGWLPDGTYGGGSSEPLWYEKNGVTAFGDDHPEEGARFFAHEIGHLLGRQHTNTAANADDIRCARNNCPVQSDYPGTPNQWKGFVDLDSDWVNDVNGPFLPPPFADSKIQNHGVDGYGFGWLLASDSALRKPDSTYDFMSYCGTLADDAVWTSPWTYQRLYDHVDGLQPRLARSSGHSAVESFLIASGLAYTDNTTALDPTWVVSSTSTPSNPPVGTVYCLEAQNSTGTVLSSRCFDLAFTDYETGQPTNVDGFNLILPYPPGVARIVLKKGATELAIRSASPHAPSVTVLAPNGSETWAASGTQTITWTASDLDGDPLTYSVLYSPDGNNWVPVGIATTATQLVVNAAELAGGIAARVRVLATDGVNTSSDDSDAAFAIGSKGPSAFILAPTGDVRFMSGTPLWLQGYGYDLEDGTLEGSALRWRSDRDGDLGAGSQALVTLSPGQHVITLTAADKDGNAATASITVFVGSRTYLPAITRFQSQ